VAQRTHAPETLYLSQSSSSSSSSSASSSSSSSSSSPSRKRAPLDWRHGYVLRYEPTQRSSLTPHTDDAEITLNVCLSPDGSFEGGELLLGGVRGKRDHGNKSGNWLDPTVGIYYSKRTLLRSATSRMLPCRVVLYHSCTTCSEENSQLEAGHSLFVSILFFSILADICRGSRCLLAFPRQRSLAPRPSEACSSASHGW